MLMLQAVAKYCANKEKMPWGYFSVRRRERGGGVKGCGSPLLLYFVVNNSQQSKAARLGPSQRPTRKR